MSLLDEAGNSIKTITTEEDVTSSKWNLHAAGSEPSAKVERGKPRVMYGIWPDAVLCLCIRGQMFPSVFHTT